VVAAAADIALLVLAGLKQLLAVVGEEGSPSKCMRTDSRKA